MEIEPLINQINELEEVVRKHINTHRYQVDFLKDSSNWNQICSSLDIIGDTLYAIRSYQISEYPNDSGLQYIYTYGLLQSLFLQQDGLRHLSEAFNISYNASQTLLDIRGIRNAAIGHPTKQNQKGTRFYNYISRMSMTKNGFDLLRSSKLRKSELVNVDIITMTSDQLTDVVEGYKKIAEKLEEADRMHKEKFKVKLLQDAFPSGMGYFFEKIGQGIWAHSSNDREFGQTNLRLLKETYEKYKNSLRERKELDVYTDFDLNEYFHAINRIEEYLSETTKTIIELDARIYLSYLRNEHKGFMRRAKEIDEQYQK